MINVEKETEKIFVKFIPLSEQAYQFCELARQLAAERDRAVELCVKQARELTAEQDGIDLGEKETRRLIIQQLGGQ